MKDRYTAVQPIRSVYLLQIGSNDHPSVNCKKSKCIDCNPGAKSQDEECICLDLPNGERICDPIDCQLKKHCYMY